MSNLLNRPTASLANGPYAVSNGGAGGPTWSTAGGGGGYQALVSEMIEEFPTMKRFLKDNPELKEKYEAYKTYEILNDQYGKR